MKKRDKLKPCHVCGRSTAQIGEHFFLKNEVWYSVHKSERGFLCIVCIEEILNRKLTPNDFQDCHLHKPQPGKIMSQRLVDRLGITST